jgi:hypothetical protein
VLSVILGVVPDSIKLAEVSAGGVWGWGWGEEDAVVSIILGVVPDSIKLAEVNQSCNA